ncbi:hypothetical protein JOQ06_001020 [Pogonophryne albipinna]|uniref:Uncharacterized protein n=1 Tax=Pogonophryne albipinna TaxID=1090488 RepID=A0AAD6B522_9TELE|nr:hypothetical protein JOQ06_001020 [Pogonophryne albipinna]
MSLTLCSPIFRNSEKAFKHQHHLIEQHMNHRYCQHNSSRCTKIRPDSDTVRDLAECHSSDLHGPQFDTWTTTPTGLR